MIDDFDRLARTDIGEVLLAAIEYDDWLDPTSCLDDDGWLQLSMKVEPTDR